MSLTNPYYNTASIDDPVLFFNRSKEVDETLNLLLSSTPQCVAIVGQRKIGKSSFAKHLSRPSTLENNGYQPDKYLFILFDCQKNIHALKEPNSFYEGIVEAINVAAHEILGGSRHLAGAGGYVGDRLEELFRALRSKGISIIIIFDEFEKAIAQEKLLVEGFFGSLRGYTQANPNFAWVTCTSRPLYVLFEESFDEHQVPIAKRKSESDFFNISTPIELNLFAEKDITELMTRLAKENGIQFSDSAINNISYFGGRFPYFIQRACYHFFNAHGEGDLNNKSVLNQCVRETSHVWESFWGKLEDNERALMLSIANGSALNFSAIDIARLKELSLCYEDQERRLRIFSEAFKEFVLGKSEEARYLGFAQHNEILKSRNESLNVELEEAKKRHEQAKATIEEKGAALSRIGAENDSIKAALEESVTQVGDLDKKLVRQLAANNSLQRRLLRKSLYLRISIAFTLTIFSLQLLFLHKNFDLLPALDAHPKKINIYIFSCLIVAGIDWAIIDSKHWRLALLTILGAALIGMAQIL